MTVCDSSRVSGRLSLHSNDHGKSCGASAVAAGAGQKQHLPRRRISGGSAGGRAHREQKETHEYSNNSAAAGEGVRG